MHAEQTTGDLDIIRTTDAPASALRPTSKNPDRLLSCGLFCATLFLHAVLALFIGANGWDDGSITLAFARTFAESGQIALTPPSETVEGFSSPFWFLLMAGTCRMLPLDFDGMILASQLWSGIFAAIGAVLVHTMLRPYGRVQAWLVSLVLFGYGPFLNETINGMEMTSLSAVALAIVWLLRSGHRYAWIGLTLLAATAPWIRAEAVGYVIAGAVLLALWSKEYRRAWALTAGAVLSLAVLTAVRLAIFGSLLPNTMIAKQSSPYSTDSTIRHLLQMFVAAVEVLYVLLPAAVIAIVALTGMRGGLRSAGTEALRRMRSRGVHPVVSFSLGYIAAVAAFNVGIGRNWGYIGRMEQSAIALGVVAVALAKPRVMRFLRPTPRLFAVIAAMLLLTACGIEKQFIAARLDPERQAAVTPATYREAGQAMDAVRVKLGKPELTVLTPDVGGSSLCCSRLKILDLALLANTELARDGYAAMPAYLETGRPDLVETHGMWSEASKLYDVASFRDDYTPVVVHGMWMYLRNDLHPELHSRCTPITPENARSLRYRGSEVDERYVRSLKLDSVCRLS
ncbi:hypothetical protein [Streptomyces regalis]|uniref:Glycosyltransferase RgtA/B/C/D-like domain-containing protein n=1 Tax=Streptomyces regalis TaxID=68262 RepID=A0A101JJY4_9ACTN|nr:hypothetical protein [Streptomyces regalis]KUL28216.1 hypothetical protein ADL12_28715 [Streptomyces regalis]